MGLTCDIPLSCVPTPFPARALAHAAFPLLLRHGWQKRLATETKKLSELKPAHIAELLKFLGKAPLSEASSIALQKAEESYARLLHSCCTLLEPRAWS